MAYSTVDDLLLGDIPLSTVLSREKFISDAADEIDSWIGAIYVTPIDVSAGSPVARHSKLLIKRINNFLATGRLILAIDAGGEDSSLHAYGLRLVTEALDALRQIVAGVVDIEGGTKSPGDDAADDAPMIKNQDSASAVDAFYDRVMSPEKLNWTYRDWAPGDDPTGTVPV